MDDVSGEVTGVDGGSRKKIQQSEGSAVKCRKMCGVTAVKEYTGS